jgi:membrane-bound inhibitor of C-type lysozyme
MIKAMVPVRVTAAVVSSAALLIGCAEVSEFDQSAVGGGTTTLVCDGGKTFTVTYQDGFETAVVETDGRRVELTKVRTTLGLNPTPPLRSEFDTSDTAFRAQGDMGFDTGATGVRYADGDSLLLSRGRQATLQLDGETFSNCETPR